MSTQHSVDFVLEDEGCRGYSKNITLQHHKYAKAIALREPVLSLSFEAKGNVCAQFYTHDRSRIDIIYDEIMFNKLHTIRACTPSATRVISATCIRRDGATSRKILEYSRDSRRC